MDETTTGSAMQLANQLAGTQTEKAVTNENSKETQMADTHNIFTTPSGTTDGLAGGLGGGGLIGGLILGSLMRNNGGLFGGNGADVVGSGGLFNPLIQQTLGDIKAEVATSALSTQNAIANSNMDVNRAVMTQSSTIQSQLANDSLNNANSFAQTNQYAAAGFANNKDAITQAMITGMQSDANLMNAITATSGVIGRAQAVISSDIDRNGAAGIAATMAASNASALQNASLQALVDRNAFVLSNKITDDGTLTRNLISRQYEDTLNRQLSTAQAEIIELRNDRRLADRTREVEVNVSQSVNQNQLQAQTQAQLQTLGNAVGILANEIQRNNQSIVNLGTMGAGAGTQAAANTRVM
jgi:hypothetical protein